MKQDKLIDGKYEYFAFISYKEEDSEWAKWLQRKLERYKLPTAIRKEKPELPERISPIYEYKSEAGGGRLKEVIWKGLTSSKFLIVICSPRSGGNKSKWLNNGIHHFIVSGQEENIIPFIIEGKPKVENSDEECFPSELLELKDDRELRGININEMGRDAAAVKVVSKMFDVKFDSLWQRYEREKKRKRWMIILLAIAALVVAGFFMNMSRTISKQNTSLREAAERMQADSILQAQHIKRIIEDSVALAQQNDSIQRQFVLIEQQKNDLAIANNHLNQKNRDLKNANANIYKAMQESEAKRLAERSLTLLKNGDSYEARQVAIHALPPYFPYTPEAEHALINAEAQNTAVIHGYSGYGLSYSTNCAEFSPDGKYIATGASHEQVKIWDANNGQELLSLTSDTLIAGYGNSISKRKCHSITFSKDGNFLLAGLSDGTARLWDMKTFTEYRRFDSKRKDNVNLNTTWNITDGEKVLGSHTETPKERKVACETHAAFSNNGKLVATVSYDGIVKIWNIKTGKLIKEIDNIIHAMEDVSFSPNDKQLLLFLRTNIGGENPITIYDLEKKDTTFTVYGNCAAFSRDGKTLAVGSYTTDDICIYDIKTHEVLYTLQGHKAQINTISFDQTGQYIVSSSNDNTVRLWHIDSSKKKLNKKNNKYESVWELIKTYEGHQKKVNSASFSYDGRRIVSTSDDNTIRLWDVPLNSKLSRTISHSCSFAIYSSDGKYYLGTKGAKIKGRFLDVDIPVLYDSKTHKPIKELRGHSNNVLFATFSPNNRNIVTTSSDSTLNIWNIYVDSVIHILKGHQGSIAHADYSKDGKYIVSAGCDKSIKIWDTNSGKELYTGIGHEEEVHSVCFNQNGQYIVSASIDGSVRIWNNQAECQKILIHNPYISADFACYSPCGKYIAAGFNDGKIRIWDSSNYNELYVIKAHDLWIRYLSFSRDGKKLISASQDKTVKIWDTATGHELRTILCDDIVKTACLSPDMKECLIAVSGHGIKCVEIPTIGEVIDKASKRFVKTNLSMLIADNLVEHDAYAATRIVVKDIEDNDTKISPEIERILRKADYANNTTIKTDSLMTFSAMFSSDGKHILTAGDYAPKIWDAENGKLERTFYGHENFVYSASYSPNGRFVLSTGYDKTNYVWNVISGDSIHMLQGHGNIISDACFSPDNRYVLTSSWDSTAIIWDVVNGRKLFNLVGHNDKINTSIFSPDGTRILTTSDDKTAILWNAKNGKQLFTLNGHKGQVFEAEFSPDGNFVATVSSDSTMILWDATTGKMIRRFTGHSSEIKNLSYSPDSKYLVTVSKDHTAIVWDAETGEILKKLTSYSVDQIHPQFSPDGKLLAIATLDSMALVWEWKSNVKKILKGHNGYITSISFNPNGKTLATASSDGQVKLWNMREFYETKISANWGEIESISVNPTNNDVFVVENSISNMSRYTNKEDNPILPSPSLIYSALYTPDGKQIIAATDDGVKAWDKENKGNTQTISTIKTQFVSISPDGRRLLTIEDSIVVLRDKFTGRILHEFKVGRDLYSAIFSPDNSLIAISSNGRILVFDANDYHKRGQFILEGYTNAQFSGNANYLASPANNCIKIWDSSTFSEIACLKDSGHHNCIGFSPNTQYLLEINSDDYYKSYNSKLQLWDWKKEQIIRTLNFNCQVIASYSPDWETIVVAPLSEKNIYLIDNQDYTIIDTIPGTKYNTCGQTSICFSPNGQSIMAVVQERNFRSSSIQTWDCLNKWKTSQYKIPHASFATYSYDGKTIATAQGKNVTIRDANNGNILHILSGHTDNVNSLVFSKNRKYIASASNDGKVIIWDANNADSVKTFNNHLSKVNSVAFSPNEKYLATASSDWSVIIWDIMNNRVIHSFYHKGAVQSVSFASNGKYVLTASSDKTAVIWDVETGTKIVELVGHAKSVNSAFFSPDNQYVITASDDNTAIVWDVKSGKPLQSFKTINNAVFDNTGKRIIGWNNSDVRFIDFPSVEKLLKRAKQLFRQESNNHNTKI